MFEGENLMKEFWDELCKKLQELADGYIIKTKENPIDKETDEEIDDELL